MNKSFLNLKNFWKNKNVFITGHTGFKGTWLSLFLNLQGAHIFGYSLKPKKISLFNQTKSAKFCKKNFYSDINNLKKLKKNLSKSRPEIIFHLAAQPLVSESYSDPVKTFNINIMGTVNLLEAARNVKSIKSIVIITTDKVYKINNSNKSYDENDEVGGKDPYSSSKACAEIIVNSYIESFTKKSNLNNKVSTARSGNVLGGGDYSKNRLLPDILSAINHNKELIIRNPQHVRPWQHVIEPLYGYILLAQKQYEEKINTSNHAWNFGPKKSNFVKVSEIIKKIKKIKKLKKTIVKKSNMRETKILKLNSNKAIKNLKWKSKWNIDQTLEKIITWNDLSKKSKNIKNICEEQIVDYLNN
tara:strand:- start:5006 stop:6079 length:1074 start_codon:yes stop_codon:yes gene_type:complete